MYHMVFPIKFRKKIFTKEIETSLKLICDDISQRYEIVFLEIGTDENHVHFLLQSVPDLSVTKIVTMGVIPQTGKMFHRKISSKI